MTKYLVTNPTTITANYTVAGTAYYGALGTNWTVVNAATIKGIGVTGIGIDLNEVNANASGTIVNAAASYIYGGEFGIRIRGLSGFVANSGTITTIGPNGGDQVAAVEVGSGSVSNTGAAALIDGGFYAILFNQGTGAVTNTAGLIEGRGGIEFSSGGTLTNTGTILGTISKALYATTGAVTVSNTGLIRGPAGIVVNNGISTVTNSGTIAGTVGVGISLGGGGTVIDKGTISGGAGTAITFGGGANNRLVLYPGYVLGGVAAGAGGVTNTLELAAAAGAGTVTAAFSTEFTNFYTITVDAGARWTIAGSGALGSSATLTDLGTLTNAGTLGGSGKLVVTSGTLINSGTVNDGLTLASDGYLDNLVGGRIGATVTIASASASVVNTGVIAASGDGVNLQAGSLFTNDGTIEGTGNNGIGIDLAGSGTVVNGAGSYIYGQLYGVEIAGSGSVANSGTIDSPNAAIDFSNASVSGVVSNTGPNALIEGRVVFANQGTVSNSGTIAAVGANQGAILILHNGGVGNTGTAALIDGGAHYGVFIIGRGTVTNTSGLIEGGPFGVELFSGGTVSNTGTIIGTSAYGVYSPEGAISVTNTGGLIRGATGISNHFGAGTVTNTGTIIGISGDGIYLLAGGMVTDSGTISGGAGTAISFGGGGNRLVLDPGYVLNGKVVAGSGSTLELAAGGAGTVTAALSTQFVNFNTITVDAGANWSLTGSGALGSAATLTDLGTLTDAGMLTNAGTMSVTGGEFILASGTLINTGLVSGPVTISGNSYLDNAAGGTITATGNAVIAASAERVVNAGTIVSTGGDGIVLQAGGTVIDSGTISGSGTAVYFGGLGANRLALLPGAVLSGKIVGSTVFGATNTLELASAASAGTIASLSQYVNFGTITVDTGARWTLTGGGTIGSGVTLSDLGTLTDTGSLTNDGTVLAAGKLIVAAASFTNNSYVGGAVTLAGAAYLDNTATGTISAARNAVVGTTSANTVVNTGEIFDTAVSGAGIYLGAGGYVGNTAATALVEGGFYGVEIAGAAGTVVNAGAVYGTRRYGVLLLAGGTVSNTGAAAVIKGGFAGVSIRGGAGTVNNSGNIYGTSRYGIYLQQGGTVTDSGRISGAGAIYFGGSGNNRLVLDPGYKLTGKVVGNTTATNTLELAPGYGKITGAALTSEFVNFTQIYVDPGANWTATGSGTIGSGVTLTDNGVLTDTGTLTNAGTMNVADGPFAVSGGTFVNRNDVYGTVTLTNGGYLLNTLHGTIASIIDGDGVYGATGGAGRDTVVNLGSIAAGAHMGRGVDLRAGGLVANYNVITASGLLVGDGVYVTGGAGTIGNFHSIDSTRLSGVDLEAGGIVYNAITGVITGGFNGVLGRGAVNVYNYGAIDSTLGFGVYLVTGGSIYNGNSGATGAAIAGYSGGIRVGNGATTTTATVTNYGTIAATISGYGIEFYSYGKITNGSVSDTSALIIGYSEGLRLGINSPPVVASTVTNYGTIAATAISGGYGISLGDGGNVRNGSAYSTLATIAGSRYGIAGYTGTIANYGAIRGGYGGVRLTSGPDVVTNGASNSTAAVISGGVGVYVESGTVANFGTIAATAGTGVDVAEGGTVINSGTIIGAYGTAVYFGGGGGGNRLTLGPGYVMVGAAVATGTDNTLELAPGTSAGTVSAAFSTEFVDFGTITVDAGAYWTAIGSGTIGAGTTLTDLGTLTDAGTLTNAGTMIVTGGEFLVAGSLINSGSVAGTVTLASGGYLDNAAGGTIGNGGDAVYAAAGMHTLVNSGFIASFGDTGDGIDLRAGGSVNNSGAIYAFGLITGTAGAAVYITGAAGSVTNTGYIDGIHVDGVALEDGGSVTNSGTGLIQGALYGVFIAGAAGTITNSATIANIQIGGDGIKLAAGGSVGNSGGTITGTVDGISIADAGTVTNTAGLIQGKANGVYIFVSAGTVTNAGTILGTTANGVALGSGGYVGNTGTAGLITGPVGVVVRSGAGTVVNLGTIVGTDGSGVDFFAGGTVTNTGGTIQGQEIGVYIRAGAGTVSNSGTIVGTFRYGVFLLDGGYVTNASTGMIESGPGGGGVAAEDARGTVNNAGTIVSLGRLGVFLGDGGSVGNSGLIAGSSYGIWDQAGAATVTNIGTIAATGGGWGILLAAGGTVVDSGTISGTTAAISFRGTGANRLVLDPGYVLGGVAQGSTAGATNTLELAASATTGTLSGLGTEFQNFGTVTVDAGANWVLAGSNTIASGATLTNLGTLTDAGTLTNGGMVVATSEFIITGSLINSGSISGAVTVANGGSLTDLASGVSTGTTISGGTEDVFGTTSATTVDGGILIVEATGTATGTTISSGGFEDVFGFAASTTIEAGGSATFENGATAGMTVISGGQVEITSYMPLAGDIDFSGGGTLQLDNSADFTGVISGFDVPDLIDLRDINFGSHTSEQFIEFEDGTQGTLDVTDGTHMAQLVLLGNYASGNFSLISDGHGGTLVTSPLLIEAIGAGPVSTSDPGPALSGDMQTVQVQPGEDFVRGFSPAGGDKLDLANLLAGAPLAPDLSNVFDFVNIAGSAMNDVGYGPGTETVLQVSGPGGQAAVHLEGSGSLTLQDLLTHNSLILPPLTNVG